MPTKVAQGRPAKDRVQGIESSLADLTLHDGRELSVGIGGAILKTPTLKRTIDGASSIGLSVEDPDGELVQSSLLGEKFEAELDGLWFRLLDIDSDEPVVNLTLEERAVAQLRELKGPLKVYAKRGQADEVTRAEFIINSLIKSVKPAIPYYCPELHKRQPIEKEAQGKAAQADAKANRARGIGDYKGLKVKGEPATSAQKDVIDRALRTAEARHSPSRVATSLIAGIIVESLAGKTSPNILQLIPSTAAASGINPNDVEAACDGYLTGYIDGEGGALAYFHSHPSAEPFEITQAVQRSGAGLASNGQANYGPWVAEAREWVEAFEGGEFASGGSETETEARVWEVKKGETYWDAIKRLAKEVNWRAFFVAGRFFFIDEMELYRGMVRLAIDRDTPGIQKIKFKYRVGALVTDIEIEAYADQWSVPPGAVITLAEYGAASIGFGDAPVQANSKGQKAGLSNNRKAATGEGRARYLVESIESPLRDDEADARLITIKARKPTAPLPEPAAKTKTTSSTGGSGSGNATSERVHDFLEEEAKRNPPYVWGGFSKDGYDCSGFVSKALNVGGWLNGRLDTRGLAQWGESGPGDIVTVYVKTGTGDAHTEHTVIECEGDFFESGGGSNSSASGGATKFNPDPSYLAEFNVKRHPHGF